MKNIIRQTEVKSYGSSGEKSSVPWAKIVVMVVLFAMSFGLGYGGGGVVFKKQASQESIDTMKTAPKQASVPDPIQQTTTGVIDDLTDGLTSELEDIDTDDAGDITDAATTADTVRSGVDESTY